MVMLQACPYAVDTKPFFAAGFVFNVGFVDLCLILIFEFDACGVVGVHFIS